MEQETKLARSRATLQKPLSADELDAWLAKRLANLQAVFPGQPLTKEANEVYLAEMEHLFTEIGADRLDNALRLCVRECRFMPTIAEIRDKAGMNQKGVDESQANQAWLAVIEYLRKYGAVPSPVLSRGQWFTAPKLPPRIMQAVRMAGGLKAIEDTPPEDVHFRQEQFLEAYKAYEYSQNHPLELPEEIMHLLNPSIKPRLLTSSMRELPEEKASRLPKEAFKALEDVMGTPKTPSFRGPLSDEEIDRLKQQAMETEKRYLQ